MKPIPVILAVQALNGFVLPLLAYFLILLVNDAKVIPPEYRHSLLYDFLLIGIFGTTLLIGLNNVDKAITSGFNLASAHVEIVLVVTAAALIAVTVQLILVRKRQGYA